MTSTDPAAERVSAIAELWSDGDYRRTAALFAPVSDRLAAEWGREGLRVLDAATGTGNTALAFARTGAEVDAFDLTPALLAIARQRAETEGHAIRFREGDLVDIPYDDARFDLVVSTFGAFLVDRPYDCARELVRVCRPDGAVVTTGWAAGGVIGSFVVALSEFHPDFVDPDRADTLQWSDPDRVPDLFAGLGVEVSLEQRTAWFPAASVEDAMTLFEAAAAPVIALRRAITSAGADWQPMRDALLARWSDIARTTDDGIELPSDYGVAVVRPTG